MCRVVTTPKASRICDIFGIDARDPTKRGSKGKGRRLYSVNGLSRLAHATAATTTATVGAETHMRLKTMYDLDMGDHVVFPGEFLVTDRAGIVFDVRLMRGDVMPAEIADVCVRAMAHGAPINVALFYAEVSHRALRTIIFGLE